MADSQPRTDWKVNGKDLFHGGGGAYSAQLTIPAAAGLSRKFPGQSEKAAAQ